MTKKAVFTVKDLANYLNVHPMTIYRYLQKNKLPAFKIGNSWRFNKESIDRWRLNQENISFYRKRQDSTDE
ncbi:MAG: helix-turn-helix domain-containing protein [Calditrichaeota bacterium]|nr:helix-turn-helix domain-containing protein [Calditrichota bacterium]